MKKAISLLFIYLFQLSFGQKEIIQVIGKVTDRDEPSKKIFCFKAKLSFKDSLVSETDCDSTGAFAFKVPNELMKRGSVDVFVYQDFKLIKKKYPRPVDCPYMYFGPEQYMSPKANKIEYKAGIGIYKTNFTLNKMAFMRRMPCFNFKKNTLEMFNCMGFSPDTSVICFKYALQKEPTMVIEISGFAYNEKKLLKLSVARAQHIKNKLVAMGIDSVRIQVLGYGNKKPLVSKEEISQAKTEAEKEEFEGMNRTATVKILSWDYDPEQKKIIGESK